MKFIIGEKIEMTQKFMEDGRVIPVTKIKATPCIVTQVKSVDSDGYVAVQLGCGARRSINKPMKGHLKDAGPFKYMKEIRIKNGEALDLKIGDQVTVKTFESGDTVKVTGTSKGKGFQGVVKRHGFGGSPKSHGHKDQLRMPGSVGSTGPAHVFKGTRMGGRMGGDQVTVTNLEIIETDLEDNAVFVKGAVPGHRGSMVIISGPGELVAGPIELAPAEPETTEETPAEAPTEEKNDETSVTEEKKEEPAAEEALKEEAKKEAN